jgi:hypothetical protein
LISQFSSVTPPISASLYSFRILEHLGDSDGFRVQELR